MRARGPRGISSEKQFLRVVTLKDLFFLKAAPTVQLLGDWDVGPGGVLDRGTGEEDGPVTWEALSLHRWLRAQRVLVDAPEAVVGLSQGNRSEGRWSQGVGGLHTSVDLG